MAGLIMGYASFAILGVFVIAAFMFLYLVPMPRSGVNLENSVAQVGAETIAAREFERAYSTYMQSLAAGPVTPEVRKAFQFDRQILDQMILERVTIIEARKAGFDAPDAEVEQLIRANPAFLENGEFIGRESYGQTLARNNLTIEEFENSTRDMILGQKLRESVTKGATDAAQQEARFISFLQEARTRMQERGEITINEEVLGRITAGSP
jgi:hypothetical protein